MENLRQATKEDFKVGTVLIDSEGNEFGIRSHYAEGIWESNYKVHFENEARFYKVRSQEGNRANTSLEGVGT